MKRKVTEKKKKPLKDLWNHNKRSSICVIRIPEGEEKEGWNEEILKNNNNN